MIIQSVQNFKHHGNNRRFTAGPADCYRAICIHKFRKDFRAVNDGDAEIFCRHIIGDIRLNRTRDDHGFAIFPDSAAILRIYGNAELFKFRTGFILRITIKSSVTAADPDTGHCLKLSERAHTAAADTGIMIAESMVCIVI